MKVLSSGSRQVEHSPYAFKNAYMSDVYHASTSVDPVAYEGAALALGMAAERGWPVIVMGNGGSAAIAEHFVCDLWKGVQTDCDLHSNVINLGSNQSLLTAIANDFGYDEVFGYQISTCNAENAVVVAISSSGNSENILQGLKRARQKKYTTIALVGFTGGEVKRLDLAEHIIHVDSENYGVVEDVHSALMHSLIQWIRVEHTYKERKDLTL